MSSPDGRATKRDEDKPPAFRGGLGFVPSPSRMACPMGTTPVKWIRARGGQVRIAASGAGLRWRTWFFAGRTHLTGAVCEAQAIREGEDTKGVTVR